jgi:hypothetical protein
LTTLWYSSGQWPTKHSVYQQHQSLFHRLSRQQPDDSALPVVSTSTCNHQRYPVRLHSCVQQWCSWNRSLVLCVHFKRPPNAGNAQRHPPLILQSKLLFLALPVAVDGAAVAQQLGYSSSNAGQGGDATTGRSQFVLRCLS